MATFSSHEPGTFCWIELGTSDAAAAKKFYMDVFGWTVNETDMGEGMGSYYIFQKNGGNVAAMYQIGPQQEGLPPHWMSYISVSDADATTEKAKGLGASVKSDPFDVWDLGRMTVMADPQGGHFAIWQAKQNIGLGVRDESGALCWNELQARDVDAAKKFYPALFGWTMKESPEYTEWNNGGKPIGGMMESQAPPEVPSYWLPYFAVDDCDATVAKATEGGAQAIVPPMDYPNVGRFSVLSDAQGAVFAVIKLAMG